MKKLSLSIVSCFALATGFAQTQGAVIREKAKDPKTMEMAAIADTTLIDKKVIADDKKKKARREKIHKECSRMKS